ncbi:MAG: acyl-CoA hydrolase [Marivirga sp.]|jgi:acyl-CoA hydrolase
MSFQTKFVSAKEAMAAVQSNSRLFFQGAAMTPNHLIDALVGRANELQNIDIVHLHTEGNARYVDAQFARAFHLNSCFVAGNVRKAIAHGISDYVPVFLSEVHQLFNPGILPIDVAFVQVSRPDARGYCSLGTSVDVTLAAMANATLVIAQLNAHVPRTFGDGMIHISDIHYAVQHDVPIFSHPVPEPSEIEEKIGSYIAELVEDEATLQMGIGAIPNAVLSKLTNHKNLGVHTEMFSDGILPLVEKGVINGSKKVNKKGKIVSCFAMGSQKLYDFMNDNHMVLMKEASYTNDTAIIRKNPKVTAINSAIEIDLTGQVCADTIGRMQYSGVGGQMDFVRGASLSKGGKAIIAMPSLSGKGISKIVPVLKKGAGVTTTRAHVHYIVTEYGVVDLFGKNLRERAKALISIAHPTVQEELEKAFFMRYSDKEIYKIEA